MKAEKIKAAVLPTVKEIILANAAFEQGICQNKIVHMNQPSLAQAVSNCEKRAIGTIESKTHSFVLLILFVSSADYKTKCNNFATFEFGSLYGLPFFLKIIYNKTRLM